MASVEEMRRELVEEYGFSETDAYKMNKSEVSAELAALRQNDAKILDNIEEKASEDVVCTGVDEDGGPRVYNMDDPDWTKYVLSQMRKDELQDEHPTVDGLRRMANKIMGPIYSVTSKIVQTPSVENNFHASVRVRIIANQTVDGCADAGPHNTKDVYARHPVAMAESRAESRAYRRLLRLKNILSAEEAAGVDETLDTHDTINSTQVKMINNISSKLDIDVVKWLATNDIKVEEFKKLPYAKGIELCEKLNALRASGTVPEDIRGYNFAWEL